MNLAQRIGQECKAIYTLIATKINLTEKGAANGVCPLDANALIDSIYLPSFVDDIIELNTYADLLLIPTPETGKIYVIVADETSGGDTSSYRWTGSTFAMVSNTLNAADIKALYESNLDTNAFTDAYKLELDLINQGLATTDSPTFVGLTLDSYQLTGGTGTQGTVSWNADEETLDLIQNGATLQMGQEVQWHVRNNTAGTIANGTPVMATGTIGASGRITIAPMDATVKSNITYYLGLATEDILAGEDGKISYFGKVRGIDTTGTPYGEIWADGDIIYLNADVVGALTKIEPATPKMKLPVAYVINSASNGILAVRTTNNDNHILATEIDYNNATSGLIATDTQAAIDEVEGRVDTLESVSHTHANKTILDNTTASYTTAEETKLLNIEPLAKDDQLASEVPFTPAGNIAATNVQAAIQELDSEKQANLTFDLTPTDGSTNPVESNGVFDALALKENIANKGVANGYASLDASGLVPSSQLPSFVDDVLEFTNLISFPVTGESGKIYVALDTNLTYRWSGTAYVELTDTTAVWGNISGDLANQTDLQNALNAKQDNLTFDLVPTDASTNPVQSNGVFDALATKQDTLTFDLVPTDASTNPVQSNGVFDALATKATKDTAVSFNTITPTTDETYDLGSAALTYNNLYTKNLVPWFDGVNAETLKISGSHFTTLVIESDATGTADSDPVLDLRDSGNTNSWTIRNDKSDSNSLDLRYNNVRKFNLRNDGFIESNNCILGATGVSINDDSVATISLPRQGCFLMITCAGIGDYPQAADSIFVWVDAGLSPGYSVNTGFPGLGATTVLSTGVTLTGTTGVDGNTSINVNTNNTITIENRGGGSANYQITMM